jgi:hypothetical protein
MKCSVNGCEREATVKVILYDVYPYLDGADIFFEQDSTCPFLCTVHVTANEKSAKGVRKSRGFVEYPFSNQERAQGFTIYFPLNKEKQKTLLRAIARGSRKTGNPKLMSGQYPGFDPGTGQILDPDIFGNGNGCHMPANPPYPMNPFLRSFARHASPWSNGSTRTATGR